ncbi:hypothetical protein TL16_g00188 [Triparma laevis f. inornata]|uniref:Kinetochore protein NDC80 n=1 Tax=Triparma laevis f. inornata TaxID=1714386 RepID=A0A9W6Z939_9STRA|nr:hypothetical protein TL16_g00188 [Triparma laevis f. inornata]
MQRRTLGPVSSSGLNARASMGRSSMGPASKGPQRMSMQQGSARTSMNPNRQQSIGRKSTGISRNTMGNGAAKDPRPLSDKGFMNASIRALLNFLMENGYDSAISPKILARPSSKDFNNIVTFLFRKIDPNFNDGTLKFEDEVASAFKALGYPFNISKTSLYAVGSPHTWPGLLAAITWLIELLTYDQEVAEAPMENEEGMDMDNLTAVSDKAFFEYLEHAYTAFLSGDDDNDKAFFEYLEHAYTAFLSGDDDKYAALEEDLIDKFEAKNVDVEQECERIAVENDEIVGAMEGLSQTANALPELEKRQEDLSSDLEKFHQLIEQLNEHKAALEKKVETRGAELERNEADLAAIHSRVAELKTAVSQQDLSAEDVRRMQGERARVEDGLERAIASKQEHSKNLWDAETELNKIVEELDAAASVFNSKAKELQMTPETAKYSQGHRMTISIDKSKAEEEEAVVRPAIAQLKETVTGNMNSAKQELLNLLDQEEHAEEELKDAMTSATALENKARRAEEQYLKEKEQLDKAIAELVSETEEAETKITQLRDPMALETAISRNQTRLAQLNALRAEKKEAADARREAVHGEILKALNMCAEVKDYTQMCLGELKESAGSILSELRGEVVAPPAAPVVEKVFEEVVEEEEEEVVIAPEPAGGGECRVN